MAGKKTNFRDVLKSATDTGAARRTAVKNAAPIATSSAEDAPKPKKVETKCGVYLPHPDVYKALVDLAHAESVGRRKKLNDLFIEGLDLVFAKRGLPTIAEIVKKAEG
jgi:hypothetical protein